MPDTKYDGVQAARSDGCNGQGQYYSVEPWSEAGSHYELSTWFDTAAEARLFASEESFRLGFGGRFDDLIDGE